MVRQVGDHRVLYSANVGDSRAVLCRGTEAIRLTIDHKASLAEEAKRIREAGGFIGRNKRVNGVLAISRALGDHMVSRDTRVGPRLSGERPPRLLTLWSSPARSLSLSRLFSSQLKNCGGGLNDVVSAEPYCAETILTPADSYVLMACDGVWDVLSDQEAMDFMLAKVATYEDQVKEAKRKGVAANGDAAVPMEDIKTTEATTAAAAAPTAAAAASSASSSSSVLLSQPDWNEVLHLTAKALVREALDRRSLDNVTVLIIKL